MAIGEQFVLKKYFQMPRSSRRYLILQFTEALSTILSGGGKMLTQFTPLVKCGTSYQLEFKPKDMLRSYIFLLTEFL